MRRPSVLQGIVRRSWSVSAYYKQDLSRSRSSSRGTLASLQFVSEQVMFISYSFESFYKMILTVKLILNALNTLEVLVTNLSQRAKWRIQCQWMTSSNNLRKLKVFIRKLIFFIIFIWLCKTFTMILLITWLSHPSIINFIITWLSHPSVINIIITWLCHPSYHNMMFLQSLRNISSETIKIRSLGIKYFFHARNALTCRRKT